MINSYIHGQRMLLQSARSKPFCLPIQSLFLYRNASLNSAIYKGIRRSNTSERGARLRRSNNIRDERTDRGEVASKSRPKRPNHLLGLDAGEVEEKPRRLNSKIQNRSSRRHNSNYRQEASGNGYSSGKLPFRGQATSPGYSEGTGRYGSNRFPIQGRESEPDRRERTGGYSKGRLFLRDSPRCPDNRGGGNRYSYRESSFQSRSFVSEKKDGRPRSKETSHRLSYRADPGGSRELGYEGIDQNPNYSKIPSFTKGRNHTSHLRDQKAYSSSFQSSSDTRSKSSPRLSEKSPLSIPYSTASSEFLYGTSVVTAALRSKRRQMYKLYILEGEQREAIIRDADIRGLARKAGVDVISVSSDWARLMDKMSSGRPHNGYILEASPLPKLPIVSVLEVPAKTGDSFQVKLDYQSKEDRVVNGTGDKISWKHDGWRYPLILLLDGILDPGNLGNILRSAYFLGVDAVAISTRHSAPLSATAIKASAGASEHIPILSLAHPGHFINASTKNGWRFYAAVAPPLPLAETQSPPPKLQTYLSASSLHLDSPLANQPCVLVLGSEGEGLRQNLRRKVDYEIGIDGGRARVGNVDSLNVSVAAGMLCEAFLRKPRETTKDEKGEKLF
ncbi:hypothetical protein FGG08_003502 [Glutinoglossum americanum]|uniref:rRNA methyltransferase 1, mitochondrial n=1 Tax=Glutinoglossum americanum TaxID=1670608 RepID=A0A9P8I448_9PEZI|nr:hypothetical protein FGG08_003502 [Glutinoglossum americanum]